MFSKGQEDKSNYKEIAEGIFMRPLVYGDQTLLTEIRFSQGSVIDFHEHPHEQTGYLVKGKFQLTVEGREYQVEPGDSWCIKGGKSHKAEFQEESLAIEVFSPPREEYMAD